MGYRREEILRDQLLDESDRLGSREWADYKKTLQGGGFAAVG
jgi:hypothetical protein